MTEPSQSGPGVLSILRTLLHTALDAAQNRVDLFAVELREEQRRLLTLLLWAAAVLLFAGMAAVVLTLAVILLFEGPARTYAAAAVGLLYLVGAILAYRSLRVWLKKQPQPFSESSEQLKKDREWLRSLKQNS
ncbi:MAG: phage holin family protein [Verrucomicrobia bacterium]|nr:phage holin family protein [Verrucomicrobiota bacterium]